MYVNVKIGEILIRHLNDVWYSFTLQRKALMDLFNSSEKTVT